MNTQNRNLLLTFCFIALMTACSNEPKIKSATADKVVIGAPAEQFLGAYDLAKNECEKNTKTALYVADDTTELEEVAFDCIGEEQEVVAEAATETAEETVTETEMESEELEEEIPAQ